MASTISKKMTPIVFALVVCIVGILIVNTMQVQTREINFYYHNEAITVGGEAGQSLNTIHPDGDGYNESISCNVAPKTRTLFNRTYYQFSSLGNGIISLNNCTFQVVYRAMLGNDSATVIYNIDLDIINSTGSVLTNIDDAVAAATVHQNDTWTTYSVDYTLTNYTVLSTNDYLRVEWYGNVTTNSTTGNAWLRYDDVNIETNTDNTGLFKVNTTYNVMPSTVIGIIDILFIVLPAVIMLYSLDLIGKGKR